MKPSKSILDPTFVYVPSHQTDIRKMFARVRAAQKIIEFPAVSLLDTPYALEIPKTPIPNVREFKRQK